MGAYAFRGFAVSAQARTHAVPVVSGRSQRLPGAYCLFASAVAQWLTGNCNMFSLVGHKATAVVHVD